MSGRLIGWSLFVVFFATLSYASHFAGERPPRDVAYRWESSVGAVIELSILLALVLLLTRGLDRRRMLALRAPSSWAAATGISIGIIVALVAVASAIAPFVEPEQEQGLVPTYWNSHRIVQFAAYVAVVAVLGPIVEELVFRGVGYSLLERYGRWVAVVVVGVAFGLVHGLVEGFPEILTFGLGLAYLRSRTGSIYPCILLHAGFNGAALALGVTT